MIIEDVNIGSDKFILKWDRDTGDLSLTGVCFHREHSGCQHEKHNFKRMDISRDYFKYEIARRTVLCRDLEEGDMGREVWWIDKLRLLSTQEAFDLAAQGKEVIQVYEDGSDSLLDDLETERGYYPDLSKSWPEIPTIFVTEEK